jgi:periplasmic protein TonB
MTALAEAPRLSPLSLVLVIAAHLGGLALLVSLRIVPPPLPAHSLMIDLIALKPAPPATPAPDLTPPKPRPVARQARPQPVAEPPILATEAAVAAPAAEVPRVAEPVPLPPLQPAAPALPVPQSAPRFDADYLDNPKPVYPPLSRRMGEEGKVVLRVFVEASGLPSRIEPHTGSGSERLDKSAHTAVGRWKFAPARRGAEAVGAWVLVPIVFSLKE